MIRVLQVVHSMNMGGIETFLMNVYRNIDREKVQFDFIVNVQEKGDYDDEIKKLGGNIYYIPPRGKNLKKYRTEWNIFLKEHAQDFSSIHMHVSSLTNILPLKLAKKYGIKNRFIHAHNTYQRGLIHNILNRLHKININKYATRLFACSTEAGKYNFGDKKFENIKNGIDTNRFKYSLDIRNRQRKNLKILDGQVALVHIGRFMEQKNHSFLIDIFYELTKEQDNFILFLIGEGELKKAIEGKVKELGIENKVKFLGLRNDVNEVLQAMDIFLLPSLHEGLPVVGIEAQASGLKCIMSDNISKEVKITNLITFLKINDKKEWAEKIIKEKNYIRMDVQEQIEQAGYDIIQTSKKLQKYYLE